MLERIIYFALLLIVCSIGLIRYRRMDKAFRLLVLLMLITLCCEVLALLADKLWHNNMPLYHVFTFVELSCIIWYYFYSVGHEKKKVNPWGIIVGLGIVTLLNIIFLEPITTLNVNMLLVEGFVISLIALSALFRIFRNDEIVEPIYNGHFWIWCLLLLFWCFTYFFWGFHKLLMIDPVRMKMLFKIQWLLNIATYAGIATVFLLHPFLTQKRVKS